MPNNLACISHKSGRYPNHNLSINQVCINIMKKMDKKINIEEIFNHLNESNNSEIFSRDTKVVIYGAGNCGKDALSLMNKLNLPVICFLDKNSKPGDKLNGVPIFPLEHKHFENEQKYNIVVIVAIFNKYTEMPPIIEMLKSLGYSRIISFLELHRNYPQELSDRFWLTAMSFYDSLRSVISEGFHLWEDETSRQLYAAILKFRFTGNYKLLPKPDIISQYFPPDLPKWKMPMRFIDCGAFDGDTLLELSKRGLSVETIAAFEPDLENFAKLVKFVYDNRLNLSKDIGLWPCGVYSHTKKLGFSSDNCSSSHLSTDTNDIIQCISLDDAIPGFRPTLIKMDIEGAEFEALLGARSMIQESRPGLAICLYHRPEHLWQIPIMIQKWSYGYKFYLRSHYYNGFELVMYAVQDS
jgi:FkbM family methyltransferase